MSWLYERREVLSERNGRILCRRLFGRWEVSAGGNSQTCALLTDLWRQALWKRLPKDAGVKKVLMLGLGTGGTISLFKKRFPDCHITAIEWDPMMVQLMDELTGLSPTDRPEVLIGDVKDVLPRLQGKFDLICSDLFEGKLVGVSTIQASYLEEIVKHLNPLGFVLANVFSQPEVFVEFKKYFTTVSVWKYLTNWMGLFRLVGAGTLGDPLPSGYQRYMANAGYLKREYGNWAAFEVVQSGEAFGVRQSLGPWLLEFYRGDMEPMLTPGSRGRFVTWYPTSRIDQPKGWYRFPAQSDRRKTGFTEVQAKEAYWERWSSQAQRHRSDWKKQKRFILVEPTLDEYTGAYALCGLDRGLVKGFSHSIERKMRSHAGLLKLLGVRDTETGRLIAGFATLDIPEIQQSMHVTSFILDEARKTPAGVALIDEWFRSGQERRIRFFEFDGFWAPGDPGNWKGYSKFKAQFGVRFIVYPNPLVRWISAKK